MYITLLFTLPLTPAICSSLPPVAFALAVLYAVMTGVDWHIQRQLTLQIACTRGWPTIRFLTYIRQLPLSRAARFHLFGLTYVSIFLLFWCRAFPYFASAATADIDLLVAMPFFLAWVIHVLWVGTWVLKRLCRDG